MCKHADASCGTTNQCGMKSDTEPMPINHFSQARQTLCALVDLFHFVQGKMRALQPLTRYTFAFYLRTQSVLVLLLQRLLPLSLLLFPESALWYCARQRKHQNGEANEYEFIIHTHWMCRQWENPVLCEQPYSTFEMWNFWFHCSRMDELFSLSLFFFVCSFLVQRSLMR